jgi:hypothetical protein
MEKKLNMEFKTARSIGRQITHRWFTRYDSLSLYDSLLNLSRHASRYIVSFTLNFAYVLRQVNGLLLAIGSRTDGLLVFSPVTKFLFVVRQRELRNLLRKYIQ